MSFLLFTSSPPRGTINAKKQIKFQNYHFLTRPFCSGKIARLKEGHCRDPPPPPDDTWRAPLFGSILFVPPKRTRDTSHLSGSPRGAHDTLKYYTRVMLYPIRIIDCKKQALLSHPKQPVTAHVSPLVERKDRSDGKSPPMIYDSRLQGDDDSAITSGTS